METIEAFRYSQLRAGTILAKIFLKRLQNIAEVILPESQFGFRRSHSTIDMIFTVRQLQKKQLNNSKASTLSSLTRRMLLTQWTGQPCGLLLRRYGCPETFVKIIQEFHDGMTGAVSIGDPFGISHGLKQGCVLAPTLFTLFLAALLSTVSEHLSAGFSSALDPMKNYSNWLD